MPAIINVGINLLLGVSVVWAAQRAPGLRGQWNNWCLLFLMGFQALVVVPTTAALFRFFPQWSMLYGFDPQIYPDLDRWIGLLSLVAVLANVGAALVGYTIARLAVLKHQRALLAAPVVASAALLLSMIFTYGHRLVHVGDYDAYWQGQAVLFVHTWPGWTGLGSYGLMLVFISWLRRNYPNRDPSLL